MEELHGLLLQLTKWLHSQKNKKIMTLSSDVKYLQVLFRYEFYVREYHLCVKFFSKISVRELWVKSFLGSLLDVCDPFCDILVEFK